MLCLDAENTPKNGQRAMFPPYLSHKIPKKTENYRGIAINSSIGKLFNIVLCNRLDTFYLTITSFMKLKLDSQRKLKHQTIFLYLNVL